MPSVVDEWVWNMSFGKKFLKKNAGEIKLQIYDVLNSRTGYSRSVGSAGGYKDWYALNYPQGIALTVEIGSDDFAHPFPYGELPALVAAHKDVASYMAAYKE